MSDAKENLNTIAMGLENLDRKVVKRELKCKLSGVDRMLMER